MVIDLMLSNYGDFKTSIYLIAAIICCNTGRNKCDCTMTLYFDVSCVLPEKVVPYVYTMYNMFYV